MKLKGVQDMQKERFKGSHPRSEATKGILSEPDKMPCLGLKASRHDRAGMSGRSMVEMLGVLAVVGLLSVVAISAIRIGLNKARASNLVADMNRLAHIIAMDKFSGYNNSAIQNSVTEHNQKTEYQAEYRDKRLGYLH